MALIDCKCKVKVFRGQGRSEISNPEVKVKRFIHDSLKQPGQKDVVSKYEVNIVRQ